MWTVAMTVDELVTHAVTCKYLYIIAWMQLYSFFFCMQPWSKYNVRVWEQEKESPHELRWNCPY